MKPFTRGLLGCLLLATTWFLSPLCKAADNSAAEPVSVEPCQSQQSALWGLCRSDGSNAPPVVAQHFDFIGTGVDLFPARQSAGSAMGYIDRQGRWAIPAQYRQAQAFTEGLAVVSDGERAAVIDPHGGLVIPWFDGLLYPFHQGLACFVPGGRIELSAPGRLRQRLFGRPGDDPYPAAWWRIEGRAGFMDTSGRVAIAPRFEPKLNFLIGGCGFGSAGFAAMREAGHEGLIDRAGHWVVPPDYAYLGLVFSGNRKVVAMIADRILEKGTFLDTVERLDGFMGPDGAVRWRETGPMREAVVAGGLLHSALNSMLFPRWQQNLLNQDVSTAIAQAWVGSLLLGLAAGIIVYCSGRGRQRAIAWRVPMALASIGACVAVTFILGALSLYFTGILLLLAVFGLWRTARQWPRMSA